ncbi:transposase [Corynebacterium cystitidis]
MTDDEWGLLEPLLPAPSQRGRPRIWNVRLLVSGIFCSYLHRLPLA